MKKEHKDKLFPRCTKDFPAEFSDYTTLREDGKPIYRRRANGAFVNRKNSKGQMVSFSQLFSLTQRLSQVDVSNQWIVPYNPFLLHKYKSHCNVEVVSKVHVVKYIYKYIFKVSCYRLRPLRKLTTAGVRQGAGSVRGNVPVEQGGSEDDSSCSPREGDGPCWIQARGSSELEDDFEESG